MTKKDFFRLVIKVTILYTFISFFLGSLPNNLAWVLAEGSKSSLIWFFLFVGIAGGLLYFFVAQTDSIIRFFQVDKGFDSPDINIDKVSKDTIVQGVILLLGGYFLLINIPDLLSEVLLLIHAKIWPREMNTINPSRFISDDFYLTSNFLQIIIGFILLKKHEAISRSISGVN